MWTVYYEDSTFSSEDGQPWESPPWGVLAVGQPFVGAKFKKVLYNGYAYLYRDDWGCWMEIEDRTGIGLADQLVAHAHVISAVRFGRTTRDDWFQKVKREVEIAAGIRPA